MNIDRIKAALAVWANGMRDKYGWIEEIFNLPPRFIVPLVAIQIGFRTEEGWGGRISFLHAEDKSLFYNGALYVRLMTLGVKSIPVQAILAAALVTLFGVSHWWLLAGLSFVGFGFRWAGDNPERREFLQSYIGWKGNGDAAIFPRLRFQSDVSAANGDRFPNAGQAFGWQDGTK